MRSRRRMSFDGRSDADVPCQGSVSYQKFLDTIQHTAPQKFFVQMAKVKVFFLAVWRRKNLEQPPHIALCIYIYVCIITESSLLRAPWSSIQRNLAADGKRCCWMTMTVYDSHLKPFSRVDSVYCITISCNFSNRPLGFLILLCQRQSWHCTDCTKQNWVPSIFDIHVHIQMWYMW